MADLPWANGDAGPDWELLLADPLDIVEARARWSSIATEMRAGGRFSDANMHALTRLVIAYALYDRSARHVLEDGAVVLTKKTKVPQYNLHFAAMKAAGEIALRLEAELMLSPRKRGKVPMKSVTLAGAKL